MISLHPNGHLANHDLLKQTMLWKPNMSLISNNSIDVAESSIWNTLLPSHPELLDDTDNSHDTDNEEEDNGDDDFDDDDEDDDLSPMPFKSEESDHKC